MEKGRSKSTGKVWILMERCPQNRKQLVKEDWKKNREGRNQRETNRVWNYKVKGTSKGKEMNWNRPARELKDYGSS